MGYSEILPKSFVTVPEDRLMSSESLEPARIIERIPQEFLSSDKKVYVKLSDGQDTVEFELNVFLSRSYPIRGRLVKFGSKSLILEKLSVFIGFKFIIQDLSSLEEPLD